jgi:hypothetical protein
MKRVELGLLVALSLRKHIQRNSPVIKSNSNFFWNLSKGAHTAKMSL